MKNNEPQQDEKLVNDVFIENKNNFSKVFEDFKNNPEEFSSYFENMKEIDTWIKEEYTL